MSDDLVEVSTHQFTLACWKDGTPTRQKVDECTVDYWQAGERVGRIVFTDPRGTMKRYVVQRLANLPG